MTRVMIMAGGTGGHVFPAMAVADELKLRGVSVDWIGTARGIENTLVPKAGYPLHRISVQGLRGNGLAGWLLAPFRLVRAVWEAVSIIRRIQPDVVIGLGGFASGPGGVAAWLLRRPLVIHEQNAIPGLTNRLLSKLATVVFEGFPNSFTDKVKAIWVGNPVRNTIEKMAPPAERFKGRTGAINLLILGGSLGARTLNQVVPAALALMNQEQRPVVTHQCGNRHINDCQQAYKQHDVNAQVVEFIDDMATAYAEADLVICRAGALTVAEVAAAGVAAILVPYPYAVDDHQTHNASLLVEAGAGQIVNDDELNAPMLAEKLNGLCADREKLVTMADKAHAVAKLGTANLIADKCMELAHG